jgi:hypothetical protein
VESTSRVVWGLEGGFVRVTLQRSLGSEGAVGVTLRAVQSSSSIIDGIDGKGEGEGGPRLQLPSWVETDATAGVTAYMQNGTDYKYAGVTSASGGNVTDNSTDLFSVVAYFAPGELRSEVIIRMKDDREVSE